MGWCTAQHKMLLFCAKAIMKESHHFELAHLKKNKKKTVMFFCATRYVVVGHEALKNEW